MDSKQVKLAVKALKGFLAKKTNDQPALQLPEPEGEETGEPIHLIITTKKVPQKLRINPVLVPLTHPLMEANVSVCLFAKDPQSDYKPLVPAGTKVIGIEKLKKKYKQYQEKRLLCDTYELFLADERVIPVLPRLLGKTFFEKKKQPWAVNMTKADKIHAIFNKAKASTAIHFTKGVCVSIKIAKSTFSVEEICENINGSIEEIVGHFPGKWKNIQAIHLKTQSSISLPMYNSLPELEEEEEIEKQKDEGEKKVLETELIMEDVQVKPSVPAVELSLPSSSSHSKIHSKKEKESWKAVEKESKTKKSLLSSAKPSILKKMKKLMAVGK